MKKWIYYIALFFVCTGCDMTLLPETHITEEDLVENLVDIEKCFMSAYIMDDAITNKINCDWGLADDIMPMFENDWGGVFFYLQDAREMYKSQWVQYLYAGFYSSIAICNETLYQLELCPAKDSAQWSQLKGEALALRAYDHFSLVNYFGRPYYDHPETNLGIVLKNEFSLKEASRSTVQVVYDSVLSDLNRAYPLLNSDAEAPARFSKDAVTALLCRVYLFMNKWDKVIAEANKLIGKYDLPSKPADQFTVINGEGEIFTLDFSYNKYGFFSYLEGYVATWLVDAYQEGDPRTYNIIPGEDWVYIDGVLNFIPNGKNELYKLGKTYKALRIAEVYLNRAEAYCELGEDLLAREDLKAVVGNYGGDVSYIDKLSGEALMNEILMERAREFVCEGYRALDLLRKGLPVERYYTEEDPDTEEPQQIISIDDFTRILPIPHQECYLNTLIEQNPGYPRDTKL
ncbi:MAG TPA: RagB/SusD family nutrient uptake outer membrane protein [Candidatus Butyricimonas faecavium]|nr:RagB/SusD family nutrient uptake outer membrane protein [Candidatus Butyricimonas faecavium]